MIALRSVPVVCCLLALSGAAVLPAAELTLDYKVHWRFWHAGDVRLTYTTPPAADGGLRQAEVTLKTRGFVDSLYHVDNRYVVLFDDNFCADSSVLDVVEGKKKRRRISVTYQDPPGKASYLERDTLRDKVLWTKEIEVPDCVHDELAALARLRTMSLSPGQTIELPVSNGKKSVIARVDVLRRVIWLTDDEKKIPVRIRVKLRFYLGTITFELVRQEST